MRTIGLYSLGMMTFTEQMVEMPQGAAVLGVHMASGKIIICAEVDAAAPPIRRRFFLFKPGDVIPDGLSYVGSGVSYHKGNQTEPGSWELITSSAHIYTDKNEYPYHAVATLKELENQLKGRGRTR